MAYVAIAAVCAVVGVQHLLVGLRLEERLAYLLFGAAAVAAAVDSLLQYGYVSAEGPVEFERVFTLSAVSICSFLILLLWFIEARTGATRRWLLVAETGLLGLTAVLGFALPSGTFATMDVTAVRDAVLPWGEVIREPVGEASPWRMVGDLANIGFLVLLIDTTIGLFRRGRVHEARVILASTLLLALSVLAIIPLDLGWLDLPPIHPFAFLLIVAVMAWDLTNSAARASELSLEVMANERRWRQLLDDVQLLAARIDREGRVVEVNPHFERVMGFSTEDAAGHRYWDFVAPEMREDRKAGFARAMEGDPTPEVEVDATSKDGKPRRIWWRNVVLRDAAGEIEGMLSIGADITDRVAAEAARDRALEELELLKDRLEEENVYLREEIRQEHGFEDIVGGSDPLLYVLHKVRQVAPGDTSVLINGETGVGKELIARNIHKESARAKRPFVVVNCAALPPNLIESELFGHERGAFTGAERQRRGRFELAHGGTLFLDEIGELPLELQPKLLRVLQEGEIERVGGSEIIAADVRLIAATNRNLNDEMEAGRFREDLFYRVAVYPITLPPLRDRADDIPLLIEHFVKLFAGRRGLRVDEIPAELMRRLQAYHWPGNVRELQNVIERAVLTSSGGVLRLAEPLRDDSIGSANTSGVELEVVGSTLEEVERHHIVKTLEATGGQVSGAGGAAETLGLHANTLRYRMKKLGIKVSRKTGAISLNS
jgi:PAS domain S-box-containing protein